MSRGQGQSEQATNLLKTHSCEWMNHRDSVTGRQARIADSWTTSDCVFQHSAIVNRKRLCSSLCERQQNNEIVPNSSNYLFKRAVQSLWLATGCQILNMVKVNRCTFTRATASLTFLQRWNRSDSVAHVNGPLGSWPACKHLCMVITYPNSL